nr:ornithine carbamoyltransferase [Candidatus Glomeribacter gigasporarum]
MDAHSLNEPSVRHYLRFNDLSRDECDDLFERARALKQKFRRHETTHTLRDRTLALLFEKNSTRTRLSFQAGIAQLGGHAVCMNMRDTQLGRGETIEDTARVISSMVDLVMIRTFEQAKLQRFAACSRVPVINGLTNEMHPCQVLTDVFTYIEQRGPIQHKVVTWVGDANDMAHTWADAAQLLGFTLRISSPPEYRIDRARLNEGQATCIEEIEAPCAACADADLVTTDTWTSMGFESEHEARQQAFARWQVTSECMARARPDALFMHCLPAHRGKEVSAEVIDGPQSVVWTEAENRLHVQKALMEFLLLGRIKSE